MGMVSVGVRDFRDPMSPELVEPVLSVMELTASLPGNVEALIGLDFLRGCRLVLEGPARRFSLES
jgi:hypothetical protein